MIYRAVIKSSHGPSVFREGARVMKVVSYENILGVVIVYVVYHGQIKGFRAVTAKTPVSHFIFTQM